MSIDPDEKQADKQPSKTEGESWLDHFSKAFGYSVAGIKATLRLEMAFRMEVTAVILLTPLAVLLPLGMVYKALVIGSMLLVLVTELMNSSMEWVVDYISEAQHPYAKRAKDMGSAAVFFALVNAGVMWGFAILDWVQG